MQKIDFSNKNTIHHIFSEQELETFYLADLRKWLTVKELSLEYKQIIKENNIKDDRKAITEFLSSKKLVFSVPEEVIDTKIQTGPNLLELVPEELLFIIIPPDAWLNLFLTNSYFYQNRNKYLFYFFRQTVNNASDSGVYKGILNELEISENNIVHFYSGLFIASKLHYIENYISIGVDPLLFEPFGIKYCSSDIFTVKWVENKKLSKGVFYKPKPYLTTLANGGDFGIDSLFFLGYPYTFYKFNQFKKCIEKEKKKRFSAVPIHDYYTPYSSMYYTSSISKGNFFNPTYCLSFLDYYINFIDCGDSGDNSIVKSFKAKLRFLFAYFNLLVIFGNEADANLFAGYFLDEEPSLFNFLLESRHNIFISQINICKYILNSILKSNDLECEYKPFFILNCAYCNQKIYDDIFLKYPNNNYLSVMELEEFFNKPITLSKKYRTKDQVRLFFQSICK